MDHHTRHFNFSSNEYWIGYRGNDGGDASSFRWLDHSGPINFNPWKSGNPDKSGKVACVVMKQDGEWDDHECTKEKDAYICQGNFLGSTVSFFIKPPKDRSKPFYIL